VSSRKENNLAQAGQEVLAAAVLNENLAYESLLTRRDEAFWEAAYALHSNSAVEFYMKLGMVIRLVEAQARYQAGLRPSKYFQIK
jgi:hypothetical protein